MATETVTDYETTEVTTERIVCDMPDCLHTDDDVDMQELVVNGSFRKQIQADVQRVYEDKDRAIYVTRDEMRMEADRRGSRQYAWGVVKRERRHSFKAAETVDVCNYCLVDMLGVDEPDSVDTVDFETDGMEVTVDEITLSQYIRILGYVIGFAISIGFVVTTF